MQCCQSTSQEVSKQNLKASVDITLPPGGSVSFKYETPKNGTGSTHEMKSNTVKYGLSETFIMERSGKEEGSFKIDISDNIKSITAVIKNSAGEVVEEKNLLEERKSEPAKSELPKKDEEVKQGPEDKKKPVGEVEADAAKESDPKFSVEKNEKVGPSVRVNGFRHQNSPQLEDYRLPSPGNTEDDIDKIINSIPPLHQQVVPPEAPLLANSQPEGITLSINVVDIIKQGFDAINTVVLPKLEEATRDAGGEIIKLASGALESLGKTPTETKTVQVEGNSSTQAAQPDPVKIEEKKVEKAAEPEVAKLDLTKLLPGTKLMYTAQGTDPNSTPNPMEVPPLTVSSSSSSRGKFTRNTDGQTFTFTAGPGQDLTITEAGKQAATAASVVSPVSVDISTIQRGRVNIVTEAQANKFIKENKDERILYLLSANWCMPCSRMIPAMDTLARENKSLTIIKVLDDKWEATERLKANGFPISVFPTILEKKAGKEGMGVAVVGYQELEDKPKIDSNGRPYVDKNGAPVMNIGLRNRFKPE